MSATLRPPGGGTPFVLLAEDDDDTREMYRIYLAAYGCGVEEAVDGTEAVAKARRLVPDIVVTDITLAGLDGFAVCRMLKRADATARIPVIALTGYSRATAADEAVCAGFDAFLLKPCLPDELLLHILNLVRFRGGGPAQ